MTYSNTFGFTNFAPTGCIPFNGFGGPVTGTPIANGNCTPFGCGNCAPTGCGFTGSNPVAPFGFNTTGYNGGNTGFGNWGLNNNWNGNNYGFNNNGFTNGFNPGFTGQFPIAYPVNYGWNTTGFPVGNALNTPWNNYGFNPFVTPTSIWNGTPSWNWGNTVNTGGFENRFSTNNGYTPTPWNTTTPWNTAGYNQFSTGTTPWSFNPYGLNTTNFNNPCSGFTGFNGYGITSPNFGGLNTINPAFNGFTGFPVNTFGQGNFNTTPWTAFGGTFQSQFPFTGAGYGQGWQNTFNGNTSQGPVFGQGYSNSPFSSNGSFQNYPFNNGTPVNNGAIGLSREAA
jgi:hypothetical protein